MPARGCTLRCTCLEVSRACSRPGAQEKALAHSEELFDAADTSKDGRLQLGELRDVLRKSSEQYSHFAEHARFLDGCAPGLAH